MEEYGLRQLLAEKCPTVFYLHSLFSTFSFSPIVSQKAVFAKKAVFKCVFNERRAGKEERVIKNNKESMFTGNGRKKEGEAAMKIKGKLLRKYPHVVIRDNATGKIREYMRAEK